MISPKVFISHASEDKGRFVRDLYKKLRDQGIDAWLDEYEMKPGDSLVKKIFDEGINSSDVVIIVLSTTSLKKPWVQQELNASVVTRIKNKNVKIIPIVIDECEVPTSLIDTVWVKITDFDDYQKELERIVAAIYDHSDKPPLGNPPDYVTLSPNHYTELNKVDSQVLNLACEQAMDNGSTYAFVIGGQKLLDKAQGFQISRESFFEAIENLEEMFYIEVMRGLGDHDIPPYFSITTYGFEQYLVANQNNYPQIIKSVISQMINNNQDYSTQIQEALGQSLVIINHVLKVLEDEHLLSATPDTSGGLTIYDIKKVGLKRKLETL